MKNITIHGARLHNLKDINISIPKNKLVVATGVSGSGKSSLMFDIVFEEGRRQYLKSLGILTGLDDEHKFDQISGISPAVAVQQSTVRQSNPRSTVGSRTGILSLLGVLYAREGEIICSACGTAVDQDTLVCGQCGFEEEHLPASYFSYNHPNGMCIKCSGRGSYYEFDFDKLLPEKQTTLGEVFDSLGLTSGFQRLVERRFGDHFSTAFLSLPDEVKQDVLYGHSVSSTSGKVSFCLARWFQGRIRREGEDRSGIYSRHICPVCQGYRIGEEARRVLLSGKHIGQLGKMTLADLRLFLEDLLPGSFSQMGRTLLAEILQKTENLIKIRLGHLTLYREMPTLSGGEIQRLFLNNHLESQMDSLIYVLDEPTVGLHESEKAELIRAITALKKNGNTVIVVEHDKNLIRSADHIIDIGPGAGIEGGQIMYEGDYAGLLACESSLTGRYLSGKDAMPSRKSKQKGGPFQPAGQLLVRNVRTNNLKDVNVSFPLGFLTGVAGLSGSGKSSLVSDTLVSLLKSFFGGQGELGAKNGDENGDENGTEELETYAAANPVAGSLEGMEQLSGFSEVSQAPIGRSVNSNPATYIGIWDRIRKLFAGQPDAAERGLTPGHFSFNSKGACPKCGGRGLETFWLGGSLNIEHICPECQGKRYNEEALSVTYKGRNIHEVLEMSVSEAVKFFAEDKGITVTLKVLEGIGMGYIKLGQPTTTLSGGEAQRVKLAKEIGRRRKGHILYILDEPTSGLSLYDTAKLLKLLDELVTKGNSVIVIEHDPVVLKSCDWIIELGPGGGTEGGQLIAQGTPEMIKNNPASVTGRYLC